MMTLVKTKVIAKEGLNSLKIDKHKSAGYMQVRNAYVHSSKQSKCFNTSFIQCAGRRHSQICNGQQG